MVDLLDRQRMDEAAAIIGHPMNRQTDKFLASAILSNSALVTDPADLEAGRRVGLGRIRSPRMEATLTEGLAAATPPPPVTLGIMRFINRLMGRTVAAPRPITSRTWRLYRDWQLDQGSTPQCVAFTKKHWELSLPIANRVGLPPHQFYARCKERDGWPGEEGTSAWAALDVAMEEGLVASHWWWTGITDDDAARTWIQTIGPMWYGVYIPESFFRTDANGIVEVEGPNLYGHEMLVIGWVKSYKGLGPCFILLNSWGNVWGVEGRAYITEADFYRLLSEGGDLVGVVERKR